MSEPIDIQVGHRVRFRVPVRGGQDLGFGDVVKINRRTVDIEDRKHGSGTLRVDKELIFESGFLTPRQPSDI